MRNGRVSQAIIRWGPVIIMMALIFLASSTPANRIPTFGAHDLLVKKGGHFLGYALLGLTLGRAYGYTRRQSFVLALGTLVLYAISDELHQIFTSGRHPSPVDVGIDTLGGTISLLIQSAWLRWRRRTFPAPPPPLKHRS